MLQQMVQQMLRQPILQAAPYVLMAGAVLASACLFFTLKLAFQSALARIRRDVKRAQAELDQLKRDVAGIGLRLQDAEERAGVLVPPTPPRSGLNVSRRTQVIRRFRRGGRPENIAASLNLPKGEVELLLKVHRMAVDGLSKGSL